MLSNASGMVFGAISVGVSVSLWFVLVVLTIHELRHKRLKRGIAAFILSSTTMMVAIALVIGAISFAPNI